MMTVSCQALNRRFRLYSEVNPNPTLEHNVVKLLGAQFHIWLDFCKSADFLTGYLMVFMSSLQMNNASNVIRDRRYDSCIDLCVQTAGRE